MNTVSAQHRPPTFMSEPRALSAASRKSPVRVRNEPPEEDDGFGAVTKPKKVRFLETEEKPKKRSKSKTRSSSSSEKKTRRRASIPSVDKSSDEPTTTTKKSSRRSSGKHSSSAASEPQSPKPKKDRSEKKTDEGEAAGSSSSTAKKRSRAVNRKGSLDTQSTMTSTVISDGDMDYVMNGDKPEKSSNHSAAGAVADSSKIFLPKRESRDKKLRASAGRKRLKPKKMDESKGHDSFNSMASAPEERESSTTQQREKMTALFNESAPDLSDEFFTVSKPDIKRQQALLKDELNDTQRISNLSNSSSGDPDSSGSSRRRSTSGAKKIFTMPARKSSHASMSSRGSASSSGSKTGRVSALRSSESKEHSKEKKERSRRRSQSPSLRKSTSPSPKPREKAKRRASAAPDFKPLDPIEEKSVSSREVSVHSSEKSKAAARKAEASDPSSSSTSETDPDWTDSRHDDMHDDGLLGTTSAHSEPAPPPAATMKTSSRPVSPKPTPYNRRASTSMVENTHHGSDHSEENGAHVGLPQAFASVIKPPSRKASIVVPTPASSVVPSPSRRGSLKLDPRSWIKSGSAPAPVPVLEDTLVDSGHSTVSSETSGAMDSSGNSSSMVRGADGQLQKHGALRRSRKLSPTSWIKQETAKPRKTVEALAHEERRGSLLAKGAQPVPSTPTAQRRSLKLDPSAWITRVEGSTAAAAATVAAMDAEEALSPSPIVPRKKWTKPVIDQDDDKPVRRVSHLRPNGMHFEAAKAIDRSPRRTSAPVISQDAIKAAQQISEEESRRRVSLMRPDGVHFEAKARVTETPKRRTKKVEASAWMNGGKESASQKGESAATSVNKFETRRRQRLVVV